MEVALIFSPYKTQYNIIRDLLKLPMHPENQSCNFPGNQNGESFIPPLTHQILQATGLRFIPASLLQKQHRVRHLVWECQMHTAPRQRSVKRMTICEAWFPIPYFRN